MDDTIRTILAIVLIVIATVLLIWGIWKLVKWCKKDDIEAMIGGALSYDFNSIIENEEDKEVIKELCDKGMLSVSVLNITKQNDIKLDNNIINFKFNASSAAPSAPPSVTTSSDAASSGTDSGTTPSGTTTSGTTTSGTTTSDDSSAAAIEIPAVQNITELLNNNNNIRIEKSSKKELVITTPKTSINGGAENETNDKSYIKTIYWNELNRYVNNNGEVNILYSLIKLFLLLLQKSPGNDDLKGINDNFVDKKCFISGFTQNNFKKYFNITATIN